MPKRLGSEPIYIAPNIMGCIDEKGNPNVRDTLTSYEYNPSYVMDKIKIYERQVKGWFLDQANLILKCDHPNNGFIILMICMSYFEGVQEYREGVISEGRSREFFKKGVNNIYPRYFPDHQLEELYKQSRCGLFHNGMVRDQVLINSSFSNSIEFIGNRIKINPSKLLEDIIADFETFLKLLRTDPIAQNKFNRLYTNL